MNVELKHQCKNCYRLFDLEQMFSKTSGFCTYKCWKGYDDRAQAAGGYHVLARDETIARLKRDIAVRDETIHRMKTLLEVIQKRQEEEKLELIPIAQEPMARAS